MKKAVTILAMMAAAATISLAADAKAGEAVFNRSCKSCHGADGAGNPAVAKMMNVQMRDLKSPEVQSEDIKAIVTNGKGKMHPVASVTGASLDDVVAYVKSLKK
jgi:mono/diheme cytochrome c family protein